VSLLALLVLARHETAGVLLPEARLAIRDGAHEVTPEDVKALFDFVQNE
jgi:hypothetical protein